MEPLGLPQGSVRALVTLILCGTICFLMISAAPLPPTLELVLAIVMGYYFGHRSKADRDAEHHPLYLPFGAIRCLILAAFIVTAIITASEDRLLDPPVVDVMALVLGLFLGALVKYILQKLEGERFGDLSAFIGNIKGVLVILAAVTIAVLIISDQYSSIDLKWRISLVTFVAFYFGVR